jgi:hypothetical protein
MLWLAVCTALATSAAAAAAGGWGGKTDANVPKVRRMLRFAMPAVQKVVRKRLDCSTFSSVL